MSWDAKKKEETEPLKKEQFFKTTDTIEHSQGLKILVWGGPGEGKTYFALTFPPPIYVLDTEYGVMPVLRHFPDKDINVYEAAVLDPDTDEPDAGKSLKMIEQALSTLKDINEGTIVVDSGTDVWSWLGAWLEQAGAKMTSIGKPQRLEWGRANLRWRQLILRLMAKPVHFVITAQPTEEYSSSGEALGTYKPRIQKQTPHMCDIILHVEKRFMKGIPKPKHIATMTKCRFQRGLDMEIEDITFDKLCTALQKDLGITIKGATVT